MNATTQLLNVSIKRIDTELPLPAYATRGSVGFDLICREDVEVLPHELGRIPGNIIVQTPPGYMLLLTMRSSTARRKGLLMPNGVGVIDQDYSGEGDELLISVYNFAHKPDDALSPGHFRFAPSLFLLATNHIQDEGIAHLFQHGDIIMQPPGSIAQHIICFVELLDAVVVYVFVEIGMIATRKATIGLLNLLQRRVTRYLKDGIIIFEWHG